MTLYLVQHGVAAPESEDPARPLTSAGRAEAERVAARLRAAGVRLDRCLHSDKLRARQTAEIVAAGAGVETVEERAGLHPSDPVAPVAAELRADPAVADPEAGLVVVGHLPFLDRLASLLVTGDEGAAVVRFRNAGVVALVPMPDGAHLSVAWVLVPDLA